MARQRQVNRMLCLAKTTTPMLLNYQTLLLVLVALLVNSGVIFFAKHNIRFTYTIFFD
jgi:hypothetical protein